MRVYECEVQERALRTERHTGTYLAMRLRQLIGLSFAGIAYGCDADPAFRAMVECRNEFMSSYQTLLDSNPSMTAEQRLKALNAAIVRRDRCERERIKAL